MFSWFHFSPGRWRRSPDPSNRRPRIRLEVEQLEERCLLDASSPIIPAPAQNSVWQELANYKLMYKGDPQVVFMGDSITEFYQDSTGASVWNSQLAPLGAADYGVQGSTTANVLWQIEAGQLVGIHPKVIVLMIGINNLGHGQSVQDTLEGVAYDLSAIHMEQPQARILLMGLTPAGQNVFAPIGMEALETNYYLATLFPNGQNIFYLGVDSLFMSNNHLSPSLTINYTSSVDPSIYLNASDGYQNPFLTYDSLHPTGTGYEILAAAQVPIIKALEAPTPNVGPVTFAIPG